MKEARDGAGMRRFSSPETFKQASVIEDVNRSSSQSERLRKPGWL
jgi:hypothetical protein